MPGPLPALQLDGEELLVGAAAAEEVAGVARRAAVVVDERTGVAPRMGVVDVGPVAARDVVGAGGLVPSEGVGEHVLTRSPTVKEARPAASSGAFGPAGRLPTVQMLARVTLTNKISLP